MIWDIVAHARKVGAVYIVENYVNNVIGSGGVELPAAGPGVLNYELYLKLLARDWPNIPLIVEHLEEGDIPRAKKFVDDALRRVGV